MTGQRVSSTGKHTDEALARLSVAEHVAAMPRAAMFPENNGGVWAAFFAFADQFPEMKSIVETEVLLVLGRYAFAPDPFDDTRAGLNWALAGPIIDIPVTVDFAVFQRDLPALQEILPARVVTDSFMFADGYGAPGGNIIGLNSPVAALKPDFAVYLESLTSERRKKFRRADDELAEFALRFEFTQEPLSQSEFDWVVGNLKKRWGEDYLYALMQTLWAMAVAQHYPKQFFTMRVYDRDKLVFLQTLIARGKTMICQSIVKDEESHYNGIAAYTDFRCVKELCGGGFDFFDPSCRTGLNDPESIGIAKRATVNCDFVKPVLVIGAGLDEELKAWINTKTIQGKPA